MKRILLGLLLTGFILPAYSAEVDITKPESVKYYTQPQDARFRYDLPDNFSFKKDSKKQAESDDDEITLDEETVKPVKKVIKKLENGAQAEQKTVNPEDMPMNYDSFPKYYDANDMFQQQFMPMPTTTF